jgi:YVTN family beta-propeller protein
VSVNRNTNRVYVLNETAGTVTVINGSTNGVLATVRVGSGPTRLAVEAVRNLVYVANNLSNNVSVIDGATNKVTATIPVGAQPRNVSTNNATHHVFVSNQGSNSVSVIDEDRGAGSNSTKPSPSSGTTSGGSSGGSPSLRSGTPSKAPGPVAGKKAKVAATNAPDDTGVPSVAPSALAAGQALRERLLSRRNAHTKEVVIAFILGVMLLGGGTYWIYRRVLRPS